MSSIGLEGKHTQAKIQRICEERNNAELSRDFVLMKNKKGVSPLLWQTVTGSDLNSLFLNSGIKVIFDPETVQLQIEITEEALKKFDKLPDYKIGFDGQKVGDKVFAGPFQDLKPGINRYSLWEDKQ